MVIIQSKPKYSQKDKINVKLKHNTSLNILVKYKEFFLSFLFILLIPIILSSANLKFSFIQPWCEINKEIPEYSIFSEIEHKDFYANLEYIFKKEKTQINYETKISHSWEYFEIISKRIFIENRVDRIALEGLFRYKIQQDKLNWFIIKLVTDGYYNIGIRQGWDCRIPHTGLYIGKSYIKELKFLLSPAKMEYTFGFISNDLKEFKKETRLQINVALLANLDIFVLNQLTEDKYMRTMIGIEVKF